MNIFAKALRRVSPRLYVRWNISSIERQLHKEKANQFNFGLRRTPEQLRTIDGLQNDLHEFLEWQEEIGDKDLAKKARKTGVYLDEIELDPVDGDPGDDRNYGRYYQSGTFGNELFRTEFRRPLIKAIRERDPIYRKDQREQIEMYIRLISTLIGALGAIIGIIAVTKK